MRDAPLPPPIDFEDSAYSLPVICSNCGHESVIFIRRGVLFDVERPKRQCHFCGCRDVLYQDLSRREQRVIK